MKITLTGDPGSGKTTIGKIIAEKLGYKHKSMGDMRGEIAEKLGITIDELNAKGLAGEDDSDRKVDNYQQTYGQANDNFIIDGWTSFHFIPDALKIYLKCDSKVAAERVYKDQRPDEEHHDDVKGVEKMLQDRVDNTNKRYMKLYGFRFNDPEHFDIVVDTTKLTVDEVVDTVIKKIKQYETKLAKQEK